MKIEDVWTAEAKVCGQCPLKYCILERYGDGAECIYLYTAKMSNIKRLQMIESKLDRPAKVEELATLTGLNKSVIMKLHLSDILIGDITGGGTGRYLVIKAVNWPAGLVIPAEPEKPKAKRKRQVIAEADYERV
jgi:hypothetical protein